MKTSTVSFLSRVSPTPKSERCLLNIGNTRLPRPTLMIWSTNCLSFAPKHSQPSSGLWHKDRIKIDEP